MKRLIKKLEDIFAAISFAEAGEFDAAREIINEKIEDHKSDSVTTQKGVQISIHAVEA